jgi:hypothetical protein
MWHRADSGCIPLAQTERKILFWANVVLDGLLAEVHFIHRKHSERKGVDGTVSEGCRLLQGS